MVVAADALHSLLSEKLVDLGVEVAGLRVQLTVETRAIQDLEARQVRSILRCFPPRFVEKGGNRDHRLGDLVAVAPFGDQLGADHVEVAGDRAFGGQQRGGRDDSPGSAGHDSLALPHGLGYGEAEAAGRQYAGDRQKTFISPYNDGQVIAGQGTAALEILEQLHAAQEAATAGAGRSSEDVANWIVPVGGGGLISACGLVMRQRSIGSRLIGVQPEASAFTHSLFYRGTQAGIQDDPTLADGLSGAIEEDSVILPMMKEFVERIVLVSEKSLGQAIAFAWETYHERIEGSAAAALAAVLDGQVAERPSVLLISGGNIQGEVFEALLKEHAGAV